LRNHLLAPAVVERAVKVYQRKRKDLAEARRRSRAKLEASAADVEGKIARLLTLVENGHIDPVATGPRINELIAERKRIAEALKHEPNSNVIEFFPKAAERYRKTVADIHAALSRGEAGDREAIARVRALIARIVVHATPAPDPLGLKVEGSLSALLSEGPDLEYSAIGYCKPPQPLISDSRPVPRPCRACSPAAWTAPRTPAGPCGRAAA
jgi:hypothetical protein